MLMRVARLVAIILAVLVVLFLVQTFVFRVSLLYWAMLSIPVLSVIAWRGRRLVKSLLVAAAAAAVLAASPIDVVARPGKVGGVQILPVSYGIFCEEGTDCRGCIVPPNPPWYSIVLSY
jgi:hypothetical protein